MIHRPDAVLVPGFVDAGTVVGLRAYASSGEGALVLGLKSAPWAPKLRCSTTSTPRCPTFGRLSPE
jgi:hypothetical protein